MKRSFVLLTLGLSIVISSYGQKKVLTFQDAVKIALQNGVLLNQQKNNLRLSEIQRTGAYLGLGPTITASGLAQQVEGNYFNQNEGRVINGTTDRVQGSITANLTLFNGLNQLNTARAFSSALDAQSYYVNRTAQDIINAISLQYLTVLMDAELLTIAQQNHEVLKKQLEQVNAQVELGSKSPVDGYNQSSQAKAAEIRALEAEIKLLNDKALLTQTLLMDPNEEFDVAKPDWDINASGSEESELQALFDTALKSRGDYLRAKKMEQSARYNMKAAWAGMTPTISAFAALGSGYNKSHGDIDARPFDLQFKTDNLQKAYGIQIYIPILGGNQVFQNRTFHVQQKVNYLNNQILTKNTEIQVKTDVQRTYQNFKLYKRTFSASVDQLQAADMAFSLEKERYELGVTSFVDFITANKNLVQAQTDRAQAEYRLLFQKVLMDYATGTLKPEDLN
ncbi:MAG TPA: TolC family protein [Cyclobacteriaceae bacterium]